ncbi:hypothetical protein RUMGNA_02180 [Mediterraneibacter gnavus ATCC 29149]|uniref:Uncharacterized protein n=1 Tax=Mediterraneibacter gnavus (strain ATCC 29149 / DSM 114966 / JCM 6515 / VPI C7-9) TaxID=411470 RepID=A7B3Q1_MEDG7|nr:hypothetical protein RUMGNA_02180 [Mediterraneibacter gnavus ATCC 29149]
MAHLLFNVDYKLQRDKCQLKNVEKINKKVLTKLINRRTIVVQQQNNNTNKPKVRKWK